MGALFQYRFYYTLFKRLYQVFEEKNRLFLHKKAKKTNTAY